MHIGDPDEFVEAAVITILGLLIGCWFAALVLQSIIKRTEGRKIGFSLAFLTAFLCLMITRALMIGLYWATGDLHPSVDMLLQLGMTLAVQTFVVVKLYRLPVARAARIATWLLMIWVSVALAIRFGGAGFVMLLRSLSTHSE